MAICLFISFFMISTSLNSQQKFQLILASDPTKNFTNFQTHKIRGIDCEHAIVQSARRLHLLPNPVPASKSRS
jgi:hypothetical protein